MANLVPPVMAPGRLARLEQPVLRGDGLMLRPWRGEDAALVSAAYQDPGIQLWHARSLDEEEAAAWIAHWPERWQAETGAGWAVSPSSGLVVLGQLSLRRIDLAEGLAEISYWVLPAARGRQVAARALGVVSRWAFAFGLHRIEVHHSTRNPASCRVAERAGYPLEGTKRSQALHTDGWHDMHLHARLATDGPPD
jgi:ribosomal-protein-alanine N-acetyltransferase